MYNISFYDVEGNSVGYLTQWDKNVTLFIKDLDLEKPPKCHFATKSMNTAYVVDAKADENGGFSVDVPNVLLKGKERIIVYIYVYDDSNDVGRTLYMSTLQIRERPQPEGYVFENNVDYVDVYVIDARVKELFSFITQNPQYSGAAELVDIRTGYDGVVHDSAGDAVRAMGYAIDDLKQELMDYIDQNCAFNHYYENSMLTLMNKHGDYIGDTYEIVSGGGGTGGGSQSNAIVKLTNNVEAGTALSAALGQSVVLKFTFTSIEDEVPTGAGTCRIQNNGVTKTTFNVQQGLTTIDVKDFLSAGTNNVVVRCTDVYGNYRQLTYNITVVELSLISTFDDTIPYTEDILFKYTPYGAIEKHIIFKIDGVQNSETVITASGKQTTKAISLMSHGVHSLEVYATATLDGQEMESNHLLYDIMCVEDNNTSPMIASAYDVVTVKQGEQISIPYSVYDPTKLASDITLEIASVTNGVRTVYKTTDLTVDRSRQYWNTRYYPIGTVEFVIKYGSISKKHTVTVEENVINVSAVTNDLDVHLSAVGRSNNEANPAVWADSGVDTTFTDFNWKSNGWLEDSNGDVALHLNGKSRATINLKPFSTDLKQYGKTIEIEFAIRDVNNRNAVVASCMNGGIGFQITADTATFSSEQSTVDCSYGDEEKIRLAFVVESRSESRLLSIYLNGIRSVVKQYPSGDNFQQSSPVAITFGSDYCAVDVYTIRSYSTALTNSELRDNYIADMQDIVVKQAVYEDNDIYDDYGNISYDKVRNKIPVMIIVGDLPQSKGDKKNVTIKYEDFLHPQFDFTDACTIDVQGTSSQYYVVKNYKNKFGTAHQNDADQMAIKVFCMKADYAEATSTHNTGNANFVHGLYSDQTPAQVDNSKCRTTIYGFPCVIFHQANENAALEFVGKYNFNADKGAENIFGFTNEYDVECLEFKNNTSGACLFNEQIGSDWAENFEFRYPEDKTDISRFKVMHDWVVSTKNDIDKFKSEFEQHFNLHKCLIYYVYTFFALMTDQRAKNMMMTYWAATGLWEPWFYDRCLS